MFYKIYVHIYNIPEIEIICKEYNYIYVNSVYMSI